MKSFNVMLVFAAVGTAYAAVDDTRPKTPCKTMPANEQECGERSFAMLGVGKFYGSADVQNLPTGCVIDGDGYFFNSLTTVVPCVDAEKYPGSQFCVCVTELDQQAEADAAQPAADAVASSDIDCTHKNCQEWTCKNWCHCYEEKFDEIYAFEKCVGEDTCNCGEMDNAPINEPLINTDWKEIYYLYGCRNEGLPSKLYTEADVVYMKYMVESLHYEDTADCEALLKSNGDTAVGAKVVTAEDTKSTTVSKTDDTTVTKTDDTIKTDDTTETKTELKVVTADTTCIDVPEWKIDDAPFGYITCESLASSSSWSGLQCENGALVNPTFYYAKEAKESCCACGKE